MRLTALGCIIALLLVAAIHAMPPKEGLELPEALIKARREGRIDSPQDGEAQKLMAKFGVVKVSGSRSYPVVLGYFTDQAQTTTQANFQSLLFNTGSGVKSVNNYYRDMSYNTMSCSGAVYPWTTSGNTRSYFANAYYGLTTAYPRNVPGFITALLTALDAAVDFSDPAFDSDGDLYVDVLWVVHSGKGAEETGSTSDIWSHSSVMSDWGSGAAEFVTNDKVGNKYVKIDKYIIMPEKTDYSGSGTNKIIGCGVFCHEFGHALGLPDLYDTGGYSISGEGLGLWSCMAAGSWGGDYGSNATPVSLDVWCKRFLGWIAPYNATANVAFSCDHTIRTAAGSAARVARLGSASASQYWLVENRSRTAAGPVSNVAWDANLPGAGLAIYHIDDSYTTSAHIASNDVNVNTTNGSSRNRPYGVAMEETDQTAAGYASELWTGANYGEAVDVWTSGNQANFDSTGTAYPVTSLNDGSSRSGTAVRKIPAAGKDGGFAKAMQCTLYVIPGGPLGVQLSQLAATAGSNGVTVSWRTESEDGSYCWDVERCDGGEYRVLRTIPAYGTTAIPHDYSYTDPAPPAGTCYYRIAEVGLDGARAVYGPIEVTVTARRSAAVLLPPWPNPGRGAVTIPFALPRAQPVSLVIYNGLGQQVRTLAGGELGAGRHDKPWDGTDDRGRPVPSGVYIYRLRSADFTGTGTLSILR